MCVLQCLRGKGKLPTIICNYVYIKKRKHKTNVQTIWFFIGILFLKDNILATQSFQWPSLLSVSLKGTTPCLCWQKETVAWKKAERREKKRKRMVCKIVHSDQLQTGKEIKQEDISWQLLDSMWQLQTKIKIIQWRKAYSFIIIFFGFPSQATPDVASHSQLHLMISVQCCKVQWAQSNQGKSSTITFNDQGWICLLQSIEFDYNYLVDCFSWNFK